VPSIDVSAWVAPTAVVTGGVSLGPGVRVLHGAVLNGDRGPLVLGEDVVVMENAVLRGRPAHPLKELAAIEHLFVEGRSRSS
jgi:carbonic anhydrase/acetyltransferase-like protein (isoleucine patch superfamily)